MLHRLPDILRGTKVIRLDENHRCTPQVVAVATAVLRQGEHEGAMALGDTLDPTSSRVDGPVPQVVAHESDHEEAAWVAARARQSRGPGRRWSSIAVLTRTNAQLSVVQTALESAGVPNQIAGTDLGPASDLRGARAGRFRTGTDEEGDRDGEDGVEEIDHDRVVLTTFHRSKGLQWHTVMIIGLNEGLMPIASAARRPRRSTRNAACSMWP